MKIDLLGWILSDVIEDGRVSSVGDYGSPVGWMAGNGGRKHKVLSVKVQPAASMHVNPYTCNSSIAWKYEQIKKDTIRFLSHYS